MSFVQIWFVLLVLIWCCSNIVGTTDSVEEGDAVEDNVLLLFEEDLPSAIELQALREEDPVRVRASTIAGFLSMGNAVWSGEIRPSLQKNLYFLMATLLHQPAAVVVPPSKPALMDPWHISRIGVIQSEFINLYEAHIRIQYHMFADKANPDTTKVTFFHFNCVDPLTNDDDDSSEYPVLYVKDRRILETKPLQEYSTLLAIYELVLSIYEPMLPRIYMYTKTETTPHNLQSGFLRFCIRTELQADMGDGPEPIEFVYSKVEIPCKLKLPPPVALPPQTTNFALIQTEATVVDWQSTQSTLTPNSPHRPIQICQCKESGVCLGPNSPLQVETDSHWTIVRLCLESASAEVMLQQLLTLNTRQDTNAPWRSAIAKGTLDANLAKGGWRSGRAQLELRLDPAHAHRGDLQIMGEALLLYTDPARRRQGLDPPYESFRTTIRQQPK